MMEPGFDSKSLFSSSLLRGQNEHLTLTLPFPKWIHIGNWLMVACSGKKDGIEFSTQGMSQKEGCWVIAGPPASPGSGSFHGPIVAEQQSSAP